MAREFVPNALYSYADHNVFDFESTMTLSLWLKFNVTNINAFPFAKFGNYYIQQDGANVNVIWNTSATHPVAGIGPNQGWGWQIAIPDTTTWHNYILVVNGDDPQNLYVDNVVVGSGPVFFGGGTRSLTNPLYVGSNNGSSGWNGAISHFAAYVTVISSGDRASLQTTIPSSVGSPQFYIDFDTSINEQLSSTAPTVTGTVNTVTGPTLSGGGGGTANPWYAYAQM